MNSGISYRHVATAGTRRIFLFLIGIIQGFWLVCTGKVTHFNLKYIVEES